MFSVCKRQDLSVEGSFDISDTTIASESDCEQIKSLAICSHEKSSCLDDNSTSASEDSTSSSDNATVDLSIRWNALNEYQCLENLLVS